MTPIRILLPALAAFAVVSCGNGSGGGGGGQYDTAPASAYPSGAAAPAAPSNPVYDTPAAYEENPTTRSGAPAAAAMDPYNPEPSATPGAPTAPAAPGRVPAAATPQVPAAPSNGAAIIHTVVAGDTLSGISAKYKVPSAAIRQANNMKNDTVVLGRKMVIPPVR